ncbi:Rossmann-like and DUF2520 domain-containing protein [Flavobacterium sp.]|uniref:Rossmann-like and DUF2520 domain-containing protein n=1 Tax=Flavobacterium sp. TaxID=239 RepID=UPI002B4AAEB0|nr:Rossmann-like and DUF2520 domain-containing protein [Flavobacterium sp.]HLP64828.1 Rossmann-like and DUF2520 domain-containing protein [Flavobacterium sp.]
MISISIIGSGNVAQHLIKAIVKSDQLELVQVFARNPETISHLISSDQITSEIAALKEAHLFIISVSDDAIQSVSNSLIFTDKLVAHTSGSVSMEDLNDSNRKAVLYPLQTLSKKKEVDFTTVPICIEAQNQADFQLLTEVANRLSDHVYNVNSDQRKSLHVAAVFVSNFTNHLYKIGNDICTEHEVPFEILKPLINETAKKIQTLAPTDAQTGPAKRNDSTTINKHLAILTDENQKEIYKILTKSIIDHGKKL